jgi:2-polyprenyl-3-methyl-5-hydroxy-6-metoxy-1,4-benzoquinol methylase
MIEVSDVVSAYRVMLGREPESPEAINFHRQAPDVATLRKRIASSAEFQQVNGAFLIGQHLNEERCGVDVSATPEQLASLFERTAQDWRGLGATEPFWSVITDPSFTREAIDQNRESFYATGADEIRRLGSLLRRNGFDFPRGHALDFGCGVGRLSLALAAHVDTIIGVDVSEAHLSHARDRQKSVGIVNAQFKAIADPRDIDSLPPADFLISLIVLQHNPPPIIKVLLGRLLALLKQGGLAVFQVPVFKAGYSFAVDAYLGSPSSGDMEMHVLPQREVHAVLRDNGVEVIEIREDTSAWNSQTVSQTFLVRKT